MQSICLTMFAAGMLCMIFNPLTVFGGGPEDALSERIRVYWKAKSNKDFRSAYEMETPRFRKELSFEKYEKLNRNAMIRISSIEVRNVIVEGDKGQADVILHLEINQESFVLSISAPKRTDQWERIKGTWYKKYYPPELLLPMNPMTVPTGPR